MSGKNLSTHPRELIEETLDPSLVEAFLRDHPAFFKHRPDLLTEMELPHGSEGAVSLVERQVNLLRERNIEMRNRLSVISRTAESNDTLFAATRGMVLNLLDCHDPAGLVPTVERNLRDHFSVEFAALLWFSEASELNPSIEVTAAERADVARVLLKRQTAFCGVFRSEEMTALFPDCAGEGSAAIAPLIADGALLGAIAVGSSDAHRYDGDMGTLFIEHIAEVIVRLPVIARPTVL